MCPEDTVFPDQIAHQGRKEDRRAPQRSLNIEMFNTGQKWTYNSVTDTVDLLSDSDNGNFDVQSGTVAKGHFEILELLLVFGNFSFYRIAGDRVLCSANDCCSR